MTKVLNMFKMWVTTI